MPKLLFLDIDGVILAGDDLRRTGNYRYLPAHKIALLNEIVRRSGCLTIISSVWRYNVQTRVLLRDAGFRGTWAEPWKTPHEPRNHEFRRGLEIAAWFTVAKLDAQTTNYVILDDDSDVLPEQLPYFIKCQNETGLDWSHVMDAVTILNREQTPSTAYRNPLNAVQ